MKKPIKGRAPAASSEAPGDELDDLLFDRRIGPVQGEPFAVPRVLGDEAIRKAPIGELRAAYEELAKGYSQTFIKLMQLSRFVDEEILRRDPMVVAGVWQGWLEGKSDSGIAEQLGESEKFVQRTRLALGGLGGATKRRRGRPRKDSSSD